MAVNGTCLSLVNKRRAALRRCASQCRIIIERFMFQRDGRAQQAGPPVNKADSSAGRADGRGRASWNEVCRVREQVHGFSDTVAHV
jgi:hypothetical protein